MSHPGSRVLIVEDDADVREAFTIYLESEGYQVVKASNGAEALDRLAENPAFCLILLDLFMPVMDGWTFRTRQKADPRFAGVPVIVVSADRLAPANAQALGAVSCLVKPVDFDRLTAAVDQHC